MLHHGSSNNAAASVLPKIARIWPSYHEISKINCRRVCWRACWYTATWIKTVQKMELSKGNTQHTCWRTNKHILIQQENIHKKVKKLHIKCYPNVQFTTRLVIEGQWNCNDTFKLSPSTSKIWPCHFSRGVRYLATPNDTSNAYSSPKDTAKKVSHLRQKCAKGESCEASPVSLVSNNIS